MMMSFWRSMRSLRRRLTRRRMPPSPASSRSLAGSDSSSESSLAAMMMSLKYTCVLFAGGPASGSCRGTSGSLRAGTRGLGAGARRTAPPPGERRAGRAACSQCASASCRAALWQLTGNGSRAELLQ